MPSRPWEVILGDVGSFLLMKLGANVVFDFVALEVVVVAVALFPGVGVCETTLLAPDIVLLWARPKIEEVPKGVELPPNGVELLLPPKGVVFLVFEALFWGELSGEDWLFCRGVNGL